MNFLLSLIFLIIPPDTNLFHALGKGVELPAITPLMDLAATRDSLNRVRRAALEAQKIIDLAEEFIGTPYRYGSKGPKTFDCSGFTSYIFRQFGYTLSSSSREQIKDGRAVPDGLQYLQKGDILIFGRRGNRNVEGHAAIFIDIADDGVTGRFIHADRQGVRISRMDEPYYQGRLIGARRILPDFGGTPLLAESSDLKEDTPIEEPVYHTIRKGDNLYDIARHNHTSVDELCRLNGISKKKTLHIGQKIRIK